MKKGILAMIAQYDAEREAYIAELETEVKRLREEKFQALDEHLKTIRTHEVATLRLIVSGALVKPAEKAE
jgi:hypothetical protein